MSSLLAFQYKDSGNNDAGNEGTDALAELLDAVRAHHEQLWAIEVRARPPRAGKATKAGGRWPTNPVGDLSIIDPSAEDLGAGNKPTPAEIVDNIEGALAQLRNRLPGQWFRISLLDSDDSELASVIVPSGLESAPPSVSDANATMANEFASIVGTMSNTVRQIHSLYIESARENRNLVKVLTDSPLANAQVELLKLQLVGRQDQMEHEEEIARVAELGGILRQFGPQIMAHFMGGGKPAEAEPTKAGGMASDWRDVATDLADVQGVDDDAWSLIEAAGKAEGDDACRACVESLREHIGTLTPDKQMELMGALGPDGMTKIGEFAMRWGME